MKQFYVPGGVKLKAVVAADAEDGIGYQDKLPWHVPGDLKHFKQLTLNHIVIMGRKTFEALPVKLLGRTIWVLSTDPNYQPDDVKVIPNLDALQLALSELPVPVTVWVAGGSSIYELLVPHCNEVHLTRINAVYVTDSKFPSLTSHAWSLEHFTRIASKDSVPSYSFCIYRSLTQSE